MFNIFTVCIYKYVEENYNTNRNCETHINKKILTKRNFVFSIFLQLLI